MALFQLAGSLRLGNGLGFGSSNEAALSEGDPSPPYMESLVKLFPAEGVTFAPIAAGFADDKVWLSIILTVLIAGAVFLVRWRATQPSGGGSPDWLAVIISTVSFLLYAMAIHAFGTFFGDPVKHSSIMTVVAGVWILAVPLIPKKS